MFDDIFDYFFDWLGLESGSEAIPPGSTPKTSENHSEISSDFINDGFDDDFNDGFSDGFSDGFDDGFSDGGADSFFYEADPTQALDADPGRGNTWEPEIIEDSTSRSAQFWEDIASSAQTFSQAWGEEPGAIAQTLEPQTFTVTRDESTGLGEGDVYTAEVTIQPGIELSDDGTVKLLLDERHVKAEGAAQDQGTGLDDALWDLTTDMQTEAMESPHSLIRKVEVIFDNGSTLVSEAQGSGTYEFAVPEGAVSIERVDVTWSWDNTLTDQTTLAFDGGIDLPAVANASNTEMPAVETEARPMEETAPAQADAQTIDGWGWIAGGVAMLGGVALANNNFNQNAKGRNNCKDAPKWILRRQQIQAELDFLDTSETLVEKFDNLKRYADVLHETIKNSKEDFDNLQDSITPFIQDARSDVQEVRRWARSIYTNQQFEPEQIKSPRDRITMNNALETTSGLLGELDAIVGNCSEVLDRFEAGIHAQEGNPSEMLEAFHHYFNGITETLRKYTKAIPLVNIFVEVLSFYSDAIGSMIQPIKTLETIETSRNQLAKALGVPGYIQRKTPRERIAEEKQKLEQEFAALEEKLEQCEIDVLDINSSSNSETNPDDPQFGKLLEAIKQADNVCRQRSGILTPDDSSEAWRYLQSQRDDSFQLMRLEVGDYPEPGRLNDAQKIEYARVQLEKSKIFQEFLRVAQRLRESQQRTRVMAEQVKELTNIVEQKRAGKFVLPRDERVQIYLERAKLQRELRDATDYEAQLRQDLARTKEDVQRANQAIDRALNASREYWEYVKQLRNYFEEENSRNNRSWKPSDINRYIEDLYHPFVDKFDQVWSQEF